MIFMGDFAGRSASLERRATISYFNNHRDSSVGENFRCLQPGRTRVRQSKARGKYLWGESRVGRYLGGHLAGFVFSARGLARRAVEIGLD